MSILGFKKLLNVIIFQPSESPTIVKAQPPDPPLEATQVQTVQVQAVQVQRGQVQVTQVQAGQVVQGSGGTTEVRVVEGTNPPACSSGAPTQFFHTTVEAEATEVPETLDKKKIKVQRRRLSPSHREMIIDLVFNEKKTSREVSEGGNRGSVVPPPLTSGVNCDFIYEIPKLMKLYALPNK